MKYFGSKEGEPLEQCLEKLRECNYYIGIIGNRYGSVHDTLQLSITELEYEEAKKKNISRKIYIIEPGIPICPDHIENDAIRKKLEAFKQKLRKENSSVPYNSPDDLATKVISDILLSS